MRGLFGFQRTARLRWTPTARRTRRDHERAEKERERAEKERALARVAEVEALLAATRGRA